MIIATRRTQAEKPSSGEGTRAASRIRSLSRTRAASAGPQGWRFPAFVAGPLVRERRLARTVRAGGVLEERHQILLPRIQYRLGPPPPLFGLVGPRSGERPVGE